MPGPRGRDLVLLVALTLLWGVNWPIMKISMAELSPLTFRSATGVLGGLGLVLVARLTGERLTVPRDHWRPLVIAAVLNYSIWQVLGAYGITFMASGIASVLAFTMPLWAVLFSALFLGDKATPRRVIGLALGLSGLAVLMSGDFARLGSSPIGVPLMIGAAISWAAGTVYVKSVSWRISVVTLTTWLVLIGQIPVLAVTLAVEGLHMPDASFAAWAGLAYTVAFGFVFGYLAWFRIVRAFPAPVAAVSSLMIPCVGVISGAIMLGERPGWRGILALALVMAAIALVLEVRLPWRARERAA
ncbi:MAG: DMT family transporter [Alphaproteobacteria bacterium]